MKTNDPMVDQEVEEVLNKITTKNMTTYQKVKAVYDYIINTMEYDPNHSNYDGSPYYSELEEGYWYSSAYDRNKLHRAGYIIKFHDGVCHDYSSLFMVMTRAIGLESYSIYGRVKSKAGDFVAHEWTYIKLNGEYYAFDAQIEQSNLVNGQITYSFFGRAWDSLSTLYKGDQFAYDVDENGDLVYYEETLENSRDKQIKTFNNFEIVLYDEWSNIA